VAPSPFATTLLDLLMLTMAVGVKVTIARALIEKVAPLEAPSVPAGANGAAPPPADAAVVGGAG
jgi:hypothetical protein